MESQGILEPASVGGVRCPHCGERTPAGRPGEVADCSHCDHSFVLPGGAQSPEAPAGVDAPAVLPEFERDEEGTAGGEWYGDVGLLRTGAIGAAATALFYLAAVLPLREVYLGQLFMERGWVPYVISFLAAWAGALLVVKFARLDRASRALRLDLLPRKRAARISVENAPAFLEGLSLMPPEFQHDPLVRRLRLGLEHFETRGRVSETTEQLRNLAQSDEARVESSFTMLRVFIWAIPILGFIGTVMGIGASVAGFSDSVASAPNLEIMKDSIGAVTSGLGVAFDTTLLALVVSIFIMFPTSSLQKAEESLLAGIDDYCRKHLVSRLEEEDADDADERALDRLADKLVERLRERSPR